jgi:cell division protein FtsQ
VAAGFWFVWFSPYLVVRSIDVSGADPRHIPAVEAVAGIATSTPIARVDTSQAQSAIAELDWVQTVDVRRAWPDRIVIAITERIPVARAVQPGPDKAVDSTGAVFTPLDPLGSDVMAIAAEGPALTSSVEVWLALPEDIRKRVRRVTASTRDDILLHLRNGSIVRWGSSDEPAFKAEVLLALLDRRARIYDVSAPQLPTTLQERKKS